LINSGSLAVIISEKGQN
jgi:hypothetical protein